MFILMFCVSRFFCIGQNIYDVQAIRSYLQNTAIFNIFQNSFKMQQNKYFWTNIDTLNICKI